MKSNPLPLIALFLFAVTGCASRADGPSGYAHLYEQAVRERLDYMSLDIQNRWQDGEDFFLLWFMETRFSILGSERDVRTIGVSHLRFNDQGKVIFHQDFWDSSQGLDQQLPIVGGFSRWLREHP